MKKRIFATMLVLALSVGLFVPAGSAAEESPFTDVTNRYLYYYDAVMWAYENGITSGTSATEFSPRDHCTRGQVVTFLWRAAGKPEPSSSRNPFTDVTPSDYFYKPVLWAVEKGITSGTTPTEFSPGKECLEAQVITFIWRAAGKPSADAAGTQAEKYDDSDYYKTAVAWADRKKMLTNYSKFYKDSASCRCDIVYYLYQAADTTQTTKYPEAPDLMAYFGLDLAYETQSDGSRSCYQNVTLAQPDHKGAIFDGFFEMMKEQGYQFEQISTDRYTGDDLYWKEFYFRYTGPGKENVKSFAMGDVECDLYLCYYTYKNHIAGTNKDEIWNYTNLTYGVAEGLNIKDPGKHDSKWKVRIFDESRDVEKVTPTPTPTPAPTPKPTPTPTPTQKPTTNTDRQECENCDGYGKLTCGYCRGKGMVSINWGPAEPCPRCNGAGRYAKCNDCGGDGYLDPGDAKYIPPKVLGRCKYCTGTGDMKCDWCGGTGKKTHYNWQTKHTEEEICQTCWGAGHISCPACGGDGWVDEEDPG